MQVIKMGGISAKPEKEIRVGAVRAAIWSNQYHTSSGSFFSSHKVTIERVYKDMHGNIKSTNSFDTNDLPKAILAMKKAFEYLTVKGKQARPTDFKSPEINTPEIRVP
jgi:hypothetical protein